MVSYHHAQYQKKLMIQTWGNLVTDGQTDENDFIGRCPTNVERPKDIKYAKCLNQKHVNTQISFLNVLITNNGGSLSSSIFRKKKKSKIDLFKN